VTSYDSVEVLDYSVIPCLKVEW